MKNSNCVKLPNIEGIHRQHSFFCHINRSSLCCARYFLYLVFISLIAIPCTAAENNYEKILLENIALSKTLVRAINVKLLKGESPNAELANLKTAAEKIHAACSLHDEQLTIRNIKVASLGAAAVARHRTVSAKYRNTMSEYLRLVGQLKSGDTISQKDLVNLQFLLETLLPARKRPVIGSLPYKHRNYPAREPNTYPEVAPAYKSGDTTAVAEDIRESSEAPLSQEIATLAQGLSWQPALIYEYVKNNIETEWYWGCMKGAEETLRQKSGNDCDQATLLAALLRASGFPTRYVRGTIEFFAGGRDHLPMDKIRNLTGISESVRVAEYFQKAGIPFKPITKNGTITNLQLEHIWVESLIPYANYRGIVIDQQGKSWFGLDTSVKGSGYLYSNAKDIVSMMSLSMIRDEYLGLTSTPTPSAFLDEIESPLEYVRSRINGELQKQGSQSLYSDFLRTRTLILERTGILPNTMQFTPVRIANEYTGIPDELLHKVRFIANRPAQASTPLFDLTLPLYALSNQQVSMSYEPESVEDQSIIDSYGGLDRTPAYLVRLRPVLKVNGDVVAVAQDGLPMGSDYSLTIDLLSPAGTETINNTLVAGNLITIAITAQKTTAFPLQQAGDGGSEGARGAARLLYESAQHYIDRWNKAEDELAALLQVAIARPLPTVVILGNTVEVSSVLGMPQGITWKGVYVDADLRVVETVPLSAESGDSPLLFMQLASMQGSALEHVVLEDDFKVPSISTAKLAQLANKGPGMLSIDSTNIDTVLPTLSLDDTIKDDIVNAVNQNATIRIPQSDMAYQDWTGIGYIKEDPETGESGWMLSGEIAGGMTAVSPDKWGQETSKYILSNPYKGAERSIVILSPKDETTVSTPRIAVTGVVLDPDLSVMVNGVQADIDGNHFRAVITLTSGVSLITAIATNQSGRQTSDSIAIRYKIPVKIAITYPYEGAELSMSPIYVEGFVTDPDAAVYVHGVKATTSSDGRFIAHNVELAEGVNQLGASAMNRDGDLDSHIIIVNYHQAQTQPRLAVNITTPANGSTINKPSTTVMGTIDTTAAEAWVLVNNMPATIHGNQFIVNNVPLANGSNTIVVNAMDSNGAIGRTEINVAANTVLPYVQLRASITSGTGPLTTYFTAETSLSNVVVSYQIDFDGDGIVDYSGQNFDNIMHTYTAEGIYNPKVIVTDDKGNAYADSMVIVVQGKAIVDILLRKKWDEMKAKLLAQDVAGATAHFKDREKERYTEIFTSLGQRLPTIVQNMQDIQLIEVNNNAAQYRITRDQLFGGQIQPTTYYIYFSMDQHGMWKIDRF